MTMIIYTQQALCTTRHRRSAAACLRLAVAALSSQFVSANTSVATHNSTANGCRASNNIPPLDPTRVAIIEAYGAKIVALEPMGAMVSGLSLSQPVPPPQDVLFALEQEMAYRGFVVFQGQDLTVNQLLNASEWWGSMELHSTHSVHPATPHNNPHIFRLSNDPAHGIVGVGPQWHNDGSFLSGTFSHVGYHMVHAPQEGGGTHFAHQGAAFDFLSTEQQEYWQRLTSVNSNSGVLHPVVHEHPVSKRKSVWLHLGMTGGVIEKLPDGNGFRLLDALELTKLMNDYNNLLNQGFEAGYSIAYEYESGDCIFIDNLAVAHRAAPQAHQSAQQHGLRIMHRTTLRAMQDFPPQFGLPQFMDIYAQKPPFGDSNEGGVWMGGGIGFRWDEDIAMQN